MVAPLETAPLLKDILRDVSRSFYLTVRLLPGKVRDPVGIAYLLARAADTIADTRLVDSSQRMTSLLAFRSLLTDARPGAITDYCRSLQAYLAPSSSEGSEAEKILLQRIPECLALHQSLDSFSRDEVTRVVTELTRGMELDLKRFPDPNTLRSLETFDELEMYTWNVAGCVGPFWTHVCMHEISALKHWTPSTMDTLGTRFGKALQWTNILRDLPRDLAQGRCYLPTEKLAPLGLKPADLLKPESHARLKPLYHDFIDHALDHFQAATEYVQAIPGSCPRLRLACILPVWIGLRTMELLRKDPNPLDPTRRIKVSRGEIQGIMLQSLPMGFSKALASRKFKTLLKQCEG